MLEKYGIRRNRQVRYYAPEEYSPEHENHDVENAIYAALYHFNAQEYALARRAADIASNTQQGPLAKFISGICSYKLGDTELAIKKLTEFCLTLTDRMLVKNPTALWYHAEEILVRLVGNQLSYTLGGESSEEKYLEETMSELVEFADTDDGLDFRFTSQLSYQTQLKLIEYLYSNKKIDEDIYLRERNYILACMTQNTGLDLKAVAELINEGFRDNKKAQETVERLINFRTKNFTPDRYLYYKTIEIMHASGIVNTGGYIDKLIKLKQKFAASRENEINEEASEGLRAEVPKTGTDTSDAGLPTTLDEDLSGTSSGTTIDLEDAPPKRKLLSLDLTAVALAPEIVEPPIPFDTQKLVDTINRQILRHGVAHLFIKEKEIQLKETKDPSLFFNILQHKHANGLINSERYTSELLNLSTNLDAGENGVRFSDGSNSENEDTALDFNLDNLDFNLDPEVKEKLLDDINYQIFIHSSTARDKNSVTDFAGKEKSIAMRERVLAQNIIRNYYADVWETTIALPRGLRHFVWALSTLLLPFHAIGAKLTSTETKLQKLAKASIDSTLEEELADKKRLVATFSEGEKTVAVKERVLGQNILVNYYKDVWNTLALSETRPTVLKALFFIPKALITALSTAYLPVHAVKAKMTSVGTKLQQSSQAAIDSIHRAESDLKNKWHAFFRAKLPVPQRNVVRAVVRPAR